MGVGGDHVLGRKESTVTGFEVKSLNEATWPDFAQFEGRSVSASFLHNGSASMFERQGFERSRRLGKNRWVVTKDVRKSSIRRSARLVHACGE
jgi:hypothetical protein